MIQGLLVLSNKYRYTWSHAQLQKIRNTQSILQALPRSPLISPLIAAIRENPPMYQDCGLSVQWGRRDVLPAEKHAAQGKKPNLCRKQGNVVNPWGIVQDHTSMRMREAGTWKTDCYRFCDFGRLSSSSWWPARGDPNAILGTLPLDRSGDGLGACV